MNTPISEWMYAGIIIAVIAPLLVLGGCAANEAGKLVNSIICQHGTRSNGECKS